MISVQSLATLAITAILLIAPQAGAGECETSDAPSDCTASDARERVEQRAAGEKQGYTWEELVEAIPQLRKFELSFSPATDEDADDGEGTYLLCKMMKAPDSRIKRRSCIPLLDYLAYATGPDDLTNDQRFLALDILNRQTPVPSSSFPRGNGN